MTFLTFDYIFSRMCKVVYYGLDEPHVADILAFTTPNFWLDYHDIHLLRYKKPTTVCGR